MESEIAQLKKENEELKELILKMRSRYVPDEEDTQETLIVKFEENTDYYIVRIKCIGKPMWDKKNIKDEIYYLKGLPCASVLQYYASEDLYDVIHQYEGYVYSSSKFIVPKSSCDRYNLIADITNMLYKAQFELGWCSKHYRKYEEYDEDDEDEDTTDSEDEDTTDSEEYEDTTDSEEYEDDEDILAGVDEYDDEYDDEECASIDMSIFNRPAC